MKTKKAVTKTERKYGIKPWRLVKKQPTKHGHYWFRVDDSHELCIIEVYWDRLAEDWGVRMGYGLSRETNFLQNYIGEWAGPIPRPRNEHDEG